MGIECKIFENISSSIRIVHCARAIVELFEWLNWNWNWHASPSISCPYVKYLSSSVRRLLYELKTENSNCVIKNMKREMKKSKQQLATKHFRWMYGCVLSALKLCTYEKRSVNIINEERRYYTSMAMSLDLFSVVSAQCARSSLEKSDDEKVFCDDEPNVNARCWSVNLT